MNLLNRLFDRRTFLLLAAALANTAYLLHLRRPRLSLFAGVHRRLRGPLPPPQRATICAAAERLLPGALAAGVPAFLDHWLARRPFHSHLLPQLIGLADHLQSRALAQHLADFATITPEQQDHLLAQTQEAGGAHADALSHLLRLTLEAFLGDPSHGGNVGQVGWHFIGHRNCWWRPPSHEVPHG